MTKFLKFNKHVASLITEKHKHTNTQNNMTTVPSKHHEGSTPFVPTLVSFEGGIAEHSSITPTSASASLITTDTAPTYHEIIEEHRDVIDKAIIPIVKRLSDDGEESGQVDDYHIIKCIGKGQFGQVYLARSKKEGQVAIKCIQKRPRNSQQYSMNQVMRQMRQWKSKGRNFSSSDEAIMEMNVSKIRWEVYVASRSKHKNVSQILKCLDSPLSKKIWIVTPWFSLGELKWERGNKSQTIEQWDKFLCQKTTVEQFSETVLRSLVAGLSYLSKQGCIHRDIKPSNILLDEITRELKISDFGSSLISSDFLPFKDEELARSYKEEIHKIVGTPAFTAPELCDFNSKTPLLNGFKLDVWSLGVTIYCLLENKLPFWGDNEFDTFHKIVKDTLPQNGNWLHDLITTRLLEKDMSKRISIGELETLLKKSYKKRGVKDFVSKLRFFSVKKKHAGTQIASSTYLDKHGITDYDLNTSSSSMGSSFEEPIQLSEFVKGKVQSNEELPATTAPDSISISSNSEKRQTPSSITPQDTTSATSPSPIKIDTPLKNLIRTGNTPEKDLQIIAAAASDSKQSPKQGQAHASNLLSSHATIDFKRYFESPSKSARNKSQKNAFASKASIENIRKYLDFADA